MRSLLVALALLALGNTSARADFPLGFKWGTASAGFQVEMGGTAPVDPNTDWYAWTHDAKNRCDAPNTSPPCVPAVTKDVPENGPDYWELFDKDHKLAAKKLRNNSIRLSIEWSRLFPTSTVGVANIATVVNPQARDHYRAVLISARARGLEPLVTLNHFVLPSWAHDAIATRDALAGYPASSALPAFTAPSGWLDPAIVTEFGRYAAYVGATFGDLVDLWTPLNEPVVVAVNGFVNAPGVATGQFPPGTFSYTGAVATIRNEAYAQAAAYDALKANDTTDADADGTAASVGIVHNMVAFAPKNPLSPLDIAGAQHGDYIFNRVFPNAVIHGDLDANVNGTIDLGEHVPALVGKADFFGVNYYLRATAAGLGVSLTPVIPLLDFLPALTYTTGVGGTCPSVCTEFGWEIYPDGFREVLTIAGSYGLPVYVTENGISDSNEDQRPQYLVQHLQEVERVIADQLADVRGYYHWSLVDNFEWSAGFNQHFGLFGRYASDKPNRRRGRKSAGIYRKIARFNRIPSSLVLKYGR